MIDEIPTQPFKSTLRFEQTVEWTRSDYIRLRGIDPPTRRGRLIVFALTVVGIAALASRWTAPIGLLLVLVALLSWFSPQIVKRGSRDEFEGASYLRGPVTYGVTEDEIWMRGGPMRAASRWDGVRVWDVRHGWLLLAASGMPPVYLSEAQLRAAGVFDVVMALAKEHGVEFDAANRARKRKRTL